MSQLAKLLTPSTVLLDSAARDKSGALDAIAGLFATAGGIDRAGIRASLGLREELGSTGLGQGVAIPHGRLRGLKRAMAAVVRLAAPIPFDAPDGRPVTLLFALLVPENATEEHLALLSELAQMLSDRDLRAALMNDPDPQTLLARIVSWEPIRPAA
jgi:PTS system nitrogen regulatory IIA component